MAVGIIVGGVVLVTWALWSDADRREQVRRYEEEEM